MKNRSVVRKKQRLTAVLKNTWRKRRVTSNGRRRQELKRIISKRNYQEKYAEMIADVLNDTDVQAFLSAHQEELTQADIEKSYAKLYEFVQEKRKYQKTIQR